MIGLSGEHGTMSSTPVCSISKSMSLAILTASHNASKVVAARTNSIIIVAWGTLPSYIFY